MRNSKRFARAVPRGIWLYTYADFMTLLLTFFVLLFSMSSMDSSILARISVGTSGLSFSLPSQHKELTKRIISLEERLKETGQLQHNLSEIKDLLLPVEEWPVEIPVQLRDSLVQVLESDEGVVLVLSGDLLFVDGDSSLRLQAQRLLDSLTPVIQGISFDVNISGHTAGGESLQSMAPLYTTPITERRQGEYMLSAERALAVLRYLVQGKPAQQRFSVSGYGAERPRFAEGDEAYKNRRVEILLKVKKTLGGYS